MKSKPAGPLKHFVFAFLIALVMYIVSYTFIENRRTRKGPWEVTFTRDARGVPALAVNEQALSISNLLITFPNVANTNTHPALTTNVSLKFDVPKPVPFEVPYGSCIFMDTTFQPGTVVFNLFGHEIQLIPRVLTIDHQEYPWQSGNSIEVTNAPPPPRTNGLPSTKRW